MRINITLIDFSVTSSLSTKSGGEGKEGGGQSRHGLSKVVESGMAGSFDDAKFQPSKMGAIYGKIVETLPPVQSTSPVPDNNGIMEIHSGLGSRESHVMTSQSNSLHVILNEFIKDEFLLTFTGEKITYNILRDF